MSEPLLQFGPPGLIHFPRAINIFSIERKNDRIEVAIAVDDGVRSRQMLVNPGPEVPASRVDLAPVKFTQGNVTYAVASLPVTCQQAKLLFMESGGQMVPELACLLDLQANQIRPLQQGEQPSPEERQDLVAARVQQEPADMAGETWPVYGPRGETGMQHAVNLVALSENRAEVVLDDGGRCDAVAVSPSEGETLRLPLVRATPRSPAWFRIEIPRRAGRIALYFLGGEREKNDALHCVLDLASGQIHSTGRDDQPLVQAEDTRLQVCLVCRNDKAPDDVISVSRLGPDLQQLLRRDYSVSWEFHFLCRVCLDQVRKEVDTWENRSRQFQHLLKLLAVVVLFLKCYVGALSIGFPHGAFTFNLLSGELDFLKLFNLQKAAIEAVTIFVNCLGWALLFSLIPFHLLATIWIRVFGFLASSNPVSLVMTVIAQFFLVSGFWIYGGTYARPEYVPQGVNFVQWSMPLLCGLMAALIRALSTDALEGVSARVTEEWDRRVTKAQRGDRLLTQLHEMLSCHDKHGLYNVLKQVLTESLAVTEYQIWFFNEEEKAYFPAVAFGCRLDDIRGIRIGRGDPNYLGHAGMFNEVYGDHSIRRNRDVRHAFRKPPIRSQIAGPIRIDGSIRGILNVGKVLDGQLDDAQVAHFTTLVSILGVAMKNAEVFTAKEAELNESKEEVQKQILEKEFIKGVFGKYVSRDLVDKILEEPKYAKLIAEKADLTVMFTDLAGFTTISEKLHDPTLVADLLNEYLTEMTKIIFEHFGTLDKYMGDGIMAFFGRPVDYKDHALKACFAAIDSMERLEVIRRPIQEQTGADLRVRIGINTGPVVVGNMGSKMAFGYTVIGDSVNLAARLEPTNKEYGTACLISETTYQAVKDQVVARPIDMIRVKGKTKPIFVYELLERASRGIPPQLELLVNLYSRGLEAYLSRRFEEAAGIFARAMELAPGDGPSRILHARVRQLMVSPPPDSWDGVYDVRVK